MNWTMRVLAAWLAVGCLSGAGLAEEGPVTRAVAVLHPTEGNQCRGTVWFLQEGDRVRVEARLEGLKPKGKHGFHIHQYGDCTSPDAKSAGDHYNPEGHRHAGPETPERHAGDLGNVQADAEGKAVHQVTVDNLTLAGGRNPILGRAVIVHAQADDLATQPAGNAGPRIACGVIGVARPSDGQK